MDLQVSMRTPVDSEPNVILQCARVFFAPGQSTGLHHVLAEPQDWQALERSAEDHCVLPLVATVLIQQGGTMVPDEVLQRLRRSLLCLTQNNLAWSTEWQRILRLLTEAGIPAVSFKGPALALVAYGNLGLREFHDLDLLVHSWDVVRARDILVDNGYKLWSPTRNNTDAALLRSTNRQICFTSDEHRTAIDLHWGALHEMFSFQLDAEQLWEKTHLVRCEDISFLSLAPEHLLLYMCAHGTKHCWRNLCWLCDVAALVQAHPGIDWNGCVRFAETTGSGLLMKHTLLLAEQLLGLELAETIERYTRDDTSCRELCETAQQFLFAPRGARPGHLQALRYHLAFAKGRRDRARLIFNRVFVPAEQDWKTVRLPDALFFLYYLVRPIRFLLERLPSRFRGGQHSEVG
jgi:hypothetical protein